jgi:hypothetical protein
MSKQHKIPILPVSISLFCYFAYTTSFTVFETIGTPYTKEAYGWGVREVCDFRIELTVKE